MRYSFKTWPQQVEWPTLRDIWREADAAGFWDAAWVNDHFYPPKSDSTEPILESWSLLAALASQTDRLRFGTMVSANTFRHPALLAKVATTVDLISDGRLEIGVGTGWHEGEHAAYGIYLPSLRERFERLEETFEILDGLMTQPTFTFAGKHYQINAAHFEPKPAQHPRPPFVIGGAGMNKTLPLAARWADQWNFPDYERDLPAFELRIARLRELCEGLGRDPAEIEISAQVRYLDDAAEVLDRIVEYAGVGANHVLVSFSPPADPTLPVRLAEFLANSAP